MKLRSFSFALFFLLSASFLYATNDLTVARSWGTITKAAYIDKAVIVVEPQGAYAEQSLYLTYSDHGGFLGYSNVEIKHRFELPPGSVINDLWLWIGDSIMQARIIDTWTGRHIYDSIVNIQRDPAYLFKNNNQYELRVFPLIGGGFRKVKLNIITPIRWTNGKAVLELPLGAINASNNAIQPVDILFRTRDTAFGRPTIQELPNVTFLHLKDTLGYTYTSTKVPNTKALTTFKLSYNISFTEGKYFQSREFNRGLNYFQYSLDLKNIFHRTVDSSSHNVMVGMDFSGDFCKGSTNTYLADIKTFLKSTLQTNDSFNVIITGAGKLRRVSDNWILSSPPKIDSVLATILSGPFFDSIRSVRKPKILYADASAKVGWSFSAVTSYADTSVTATLQAAVQKLFGYDVIASYKHAWLNVPSNTDLQIIIDSLNKFFDRGGKFISYFNLDCNTYERVVKYYIPSLWTKGRITTNATLYRDTSGYFGRNFPEYFDHTGHNQLQYTDSTLKVEIRDAWGNPVIVSKKIGNGLLIACGIWLLSDNEPMRRLIAPPLLKVNTSNAQMQLPELLSAVKSYSYAHPYDKLFLMSNCDSLIFRNDAMVFADQYYNAFTKKPAIQTINLLNEGTLTLPYQVYTNNTYTGAGMLLKQLADKAEGLHFERKNTDWQTIAYLLTPYTSPRIDSFAIAASINGDPSQIVDFMEIKYEQTNQEIPKNFIGSSHSSDTVKLDVKVKYWHNDTLFSASFADKIYEDPGQSNYVKSSILGNEKIKKAFNMIPIDTPLVVSLCLDHRLLSDYSCFLALEPNDTIRFIKPFDESSLVPVELLAFSALQLKDSVQLQWSTASELNNRGFYIERKYDSDWLRIGYIPGSGTTTLTQHYSFLDNTLKVPANTDVAYRLVQTDFDGREKEISIIHIKFGNIPREFRLEQNYPNPFNPATTINYQLAQDVQVELKVFDVIGNLVAVLINAKQDAGSYNYQFDASRYHLSSGVYLYQLKAGNFESIRKMMLVK